MPPKASEMVSSADFGYDVTPPQQQQQQQPLEVKGHGSISNLKYTGTTARQRRRPRTSNTTTNAVNFDMDRTKTIEVEHMDDLPGDDIWYSREEYDDIKGRNSHIVRLIKAGEFEENDELSCRGLEHKLKEVFRQRRANKFNALNAVLEEQDRQINRGITDPASISAAYQTVSVKCQESANTIAFRDYRFSFNYCPNTPATGFDQPIPPPENTNSNSRLQDSQSSMGGKKDKKKKKKDKKDKKDKDKSKDKDKGSKDNNNNNKAGAQQAEEEEEDDDDPTLSPKAAAGKKKGKVRKMARGARRMMRRMSM